MPGVRVDTEPSLRPADYPFTHRLRVRFAETDAMGIVHHSRYLPYLEEARVAYLRAIGHPYTEWREAGLDSAVLEAYVRYRQPLRFDDEVDVHLRLASATRTTFQMAYLLTVGGAAGGDGRDRPRHGHRRRSADPPAGLVGRARPRRRPRRATSRIGPMAGCGDGSPGARIGVLVVAYNAASTLTSVLDRLPARFRDASTTCSSATTRPTTTRTRSGWATRPSRSCR